MTYTRKTRDEWQMWSNYGYGWEHEVSEDNWRDMKAQLKCYRENCPNASFRAKLARVRIEADNG
jgi:hypothetical protein